MDFSDIDVSTGHTAVSQVYDNGEIAFINLVRNNGFQSLCDRVSEEYNTENANSRSIIPVFDISYHRIPSAHPTENISLTHCDICFSFFIRGLMRTSNDFERPWKDWWMYNVHKENFQERVLRELKSLDRGLSGKGMVEIWMEMILKKVCSVYGFQ